MVIDYFIGGHTAALDTHALKPKCDSTKSHDFCERTTLKEVYLSAMRNLCSAFFVLGPTRKFTFSSFTTTHFKFFLES